MESFITAKKRSVFGWAHKNMLITTQNNVIRFHELFSMTQVRVIQLWYLNYFLVQGVLYSSTWSIFSGPQSGTYQYFLLYPKHMSIFSVPPQSGTLPLGGTFLQTLRHCPQIGQVLSHTGDQCLNLVSEDNFDFWHIFSALKKFPLTKATRA